MKVKHSSCAMFTPDGRTDNGIQKYLVSKDVVIEMGYGSTLSYSIVRHII